ncbi:MAG: YicC family protein [Deltaproteobacteria bacterium RIFOXYD12_FULL_57_12]|nr:MAG: YicC family protein [Deltaproteobacteria bacterium RIFOXYD12_FULL_57_12]
MQRPLSMTGFGRGESGGDGNKWVVEFRSVNHRYLDVKIKVPWKYAALEERIKQEIQQYHGRGHVDLFVNVNGADVQSGRLRANLTLAREYYDCLQAIKEELQIADQPDLAMLAAFRDVIILGQEDVVSEDLEMSWQYIREALVAALTNGLTMRENEGSALKEDLLHRLGSFAKTVNGIEAVIPELIRKRQEGLKDRLDNLLKGVDIDPVRFAQEVAILVDKADISEELTRLRSHLRQFEDFLNLGEPVGRRLDFLVQEFLRELNTMAAKVGDTTAAYQIVDLKNELEKMREQVQNLE